MTVKNSTIRLMRTISMTALVLLIALGVTSCDKSDSSAKTYTQKFYTVIDVIISDDCINPSRVWIELKREVSTDKIIEYKEQDFVDMCIKLNKFDSNNLELRDYLIEEYPYSEQGHIDYEMKDIDLDSPMYDVRLAIRTEDVKFLGQFKDNESCGIPYSVDAKQRLYDIGQGAFYDMLFTE